MWIQLYLAGGGYGEFCKVRGTGNSPKDIWEFFKFFFIILNKKLDKPRLDKLLTAKIVLK